MKDKMKKKINNKKYLSILELRWIFAQEEDKDTFSEILKPLDNFQIKIDSLLNNLNEFDHKKISQIILDQANILDGNVLSNPSGYMESLTELFIK